MVSMAPTPWVHRRQEEGLTVRAGMLRLGAGSGPWEVRPSGEGGATGMRSEVRGGHRSSQVTLTEIGGLHGVVEVLGRPWGHAVGTPDPCGQGAASCPVGAGPRPGLMSQNVHQSPRGDRGMVSDQ